MVKYHSEFKFLTATATFASSYAHPVLSCFTSLNKAKSTLLLKQGVDRTGAAQDRVRILLGVYVSVEGPYRGTLALEVKQDPGAWHADPDPNKTSCFFPLQWDELYRDSIKASCL